MTAVDLSPMWALTAQESACFCVRNTEGERMVAGFPATCLQGPETFKDVSVEFTQEEWMVLNSAQRRIHKYDVGKLHKSHLSGISIMQAFCDLPAGSRRDKNYEKENSQSRSPRLRDSN